MNHFQLTYFQRDIYSFPCHSADECGKDPDTRQTLFPTTHLSQADKFPFERNYLCTLPGCCNAGI